MAIKVILNRDVENLGAAGEVVEVKDGYARNYLLPRELAVLWTKGAQRHIDRELEMSRKREIATVDEAIAVRDQIAEDPTVIIVQKAGANGRLFGAITGRLIAAAMQEKYRVPFDQRAIDFDGPIKKTGLYDASIRILPDVTADFEVRVDAEEN